MKKHSIKVLAALLLTLLFTSMTAFAADKKVYDYGKDYDKTQGPVWFYQYDNGEGAKDIQYYKEDWSTWTAAKDCVDDLGKESYANVYAANDGKAAGLHPSILNDKNAAAIATWKAPADGKVTIAKATLQQNPYDDTTTDGVDAKIVFGGKELFSAYVGRGESKEQPEITVDVKKGDVINFEAALHGKSGGNELAWPIVVTLESDSLIPAETNPKTGDSGMVSYAVLATLSLAGALGLARSKRSVR